MLGIRRLVCSRSFAHGVRKILCTAISLKLILIWLLRSWSKQDRVFVFSHLDREYSILTEYITTEVKECMKISLAYLETFSHQKDFIFCRRKKHSPKNAAKICPFSACKLAVSKGASEQTHNIDLQLIESKVCQPQVEWMKISADLELTPGNTHAVIIGGSIELPDTGTAVPLVFCKYENILGYAFTSSTQKIDSCIIPLWESHELKFSFYDFEVLVLRRELTEELEVNGRSSVKYLRQFFESGKKFNVLKYYRGQINFQKSMLESLKMRAKLIAKIAELLTTRDRRMIENVTGQPFEELESGLRKLDAVYLALVLSDAQFVPHQLNTYGLHILRAVLAERIRDKQLASMTNDLSDIDALMEDGILIKDFYSTKEMQSWMNKVQKSGSLFHSPSFVHDDHSLRGLVEKLHGIESLPMKYLRNGRKLSFKVQEVTHTEWDSQTLIHTDRIFSSIKMFATDRKDISMVEGPLYFVKRSHRATAEKLRFWHELVQEPALAFKACPSGKVNFFTDDMDFLSQLGYRYSDAVYLNLTRFSVAIIDTVGFHRRTAANPGVKRYSWISSYGDTGTGEIFPKRNPFQSIL